ncbi:aminopeptidase N [Corynebacterium sp. TAE3-ERU12]|uniref:aminopeptidase N n=1 Tax=Corynebacterium sp. TAE3-ERU12 TaxID=2849491 RepID=UPI001C485DC8|nr:aminopeptidase N [Corynebacterium sp. TAE3-ERU12]
MTSINLTRDEARARTEKVRVQHYDVALDVTADAPTFGSVTTVEFEALADGETFIDLRDADINAVHLDGTDITDTACRGDKANYNSDEGLTVPLSKGTHTLVVDAQCRYTTSGQGLHRFVDPADDQTYMYTQFETADAKRVFACFDQPDLKATWSLRVTSPAEWTVVSNSAPTITDADGGAKLYSFEVPVPLSTYLIAFCIGPWHEVHDQWRGEVTAHPETPADHLPDGELTIDLGLFCRQSIAEHLDADTLFRETKQGFDFYAKNFGEPYPFGKYDQIFCPEFNMGAMENAGCVTIRDEYVFRSRATGYRYERRNDTVLHEMAHMWFGDLVTMQWWDDLWLNESFATWSAAAAQVAVSDYSQAWTTFANVEKSWAYQQDELPSTHPIAADAGDIDTVEQNFDGITYAKGASVLKQLVAYVGEDAFLAGARLHFARHRFGNATFDDLLEAMSETSGRDLSNWAEQWLNTTGLPTLAADFDVKDGVYTSFAVTQSGAQPGKGEIRDHRIAVGIYRLDSENGEQSLQRVRREEIDVTSERTEVPELVGCPAGDLVLVNDDDLTYARLNLDQRSLETVIKHIGDITDPMPRTLCWSATWQMVRRGDMRARNFIDLVLGGSGDEDQIAVLERVLSQAVTAATRYAEPVWAKQTGIPALAHGLLASARAAEPGSDAQLAHVNALAQVPLAGLGAPVVDVFRAIVQGQPETVGLSGLSADFDMRWTALTALIAAGAVTDPATEIDELAAEDKSAQGVQSATQARASQPTSDAKATTWSAMTAQGEDAPSNLALRHLIAGFTAPGSGEQLVEEGYTDRYFESALKWWEDYSSDTALRMLEGLYPIWDITDEAIAQATGVIDDPATPAPVQRVLSEGRDHVRRALHARAIDRN